MHPSIPYASGLVRALVVDARQLHGLAPPSVAKLHLSATVLNLEIRSKRLTLHEEARPAFLSISLLLLPTSAALLLLPLCLLPPVVTICNRSYRFNLVPIPSLTILGHWPFHLFAASITIATTASITTAGPSIITRSSATRYIIPSTPPDSPSLFPCIATQEQSS